MELRGGQNLSTWKSEGGQKLSAQKLGREQINQSSLGSQSAYKGAGLSSARWGRIKIF